MTLQHVTQVITDGFGTAVRASAVRTAHFDKLPHEAKFAVDCETSAKHTREGVNPLGVI